MFDNPVSYNDIISAISAGKSVVLRNAKDDLATYLSLTTAHDDGFRVLFGNDIGYTYSAESPDDPLMVEE